MVQDEAGVVSLWTRDPTNLVHHAGLRAALEWCKSRSILIEVQGSATGFGGRFPFLELDVPTPEVVAERLDGIAADGLVAPASMRVRIDPILSVSLTDAKGSQWTVSSMRLALVDHLLGLFAPFGIRRYIFSHRDAGEYDPKKQRIRERFASLGLDLVDDDREEVVRCFTAVQALCDEHGVAFGLCANPPHTSLLYQACIDNAHYMAKAAGLRLTKERSSSSTRRCCQCFKGATSVDNLGDTRCYPNARGCVFCYSQAKGLGKAERRSRVEVERFWVSTQSATEALPASYRTMVTPGANPASPVWTQVHSG